MEHKQLQLKVNDIAQDGTFEGLLSVYGVVDLGNDRVEPGAFTKSIAERGGVVPLLWQHQINQPIGLLQLRDTPKALEVTGSLVLEVAQAREAYALLKKGVLRGLSIGYEAIKHTMQGSIRRLQELRLMEGSLVTFPMCLPAEVTAVKSIAEKRQLEELVSCLQNAAREIREGTGLRK